MSKVSRRAVLAGAAIVMPAARAVAAPSLSFTGNAIQGGAIIGHTTPGATFTVDGEPLGTASAHGLFVVGFDRDAKPETIITVGNSDGRAELALRVDPVEYDIQRVDGLPQETVTPQGDDVLARIAAEAERKRAGFASRIDADWFASGFIMPLEATRVSGRFGGQRILNGTPSTPHYGADLAAPIGAPIHSPARGLVSFAETGMFYEGGLVMIDHGQGLVSAYLHMSRVDAVPGQIVEQGQLIGAVGMEGRATGPHLCWRLKWRARNMDPTLLVDPKVAAI